jgi:hypothetical protein
MKRITLALALLGLTVVPLVAAPADGGTPVMKVAVYADGRIVSDGHEISLPALRDAFLKLSNAHGSVLYYREAAQSEPHPNAMAVIKAIVDARLPVSLSSKPDFSDVVLPDGSTKPR